MQVIAGRPSAPAFEPGPAGLGRRALVAPLAIICASISILVAGSIWATWRHEYDAGVASLAAIAEMRAVQVEEWVAERRADALQAQSSEPVIEAARHVAETGGAAAGAELERRLAVFRGRHGWRDAMLLAPDTARLWTAQGSGASVPPELRGAAVRAAATGKVAHVGPYLDADGKAWIDFLAPLPSSGDKGVRTLVLRADPARSLSAIMGRWPVPSQTGETVLCRREGDTVLFISELRFRPGSALKLRAPIKGSRLGAARYLQDRRSRSGLEAVDYRGHSVVAVGSAVAGTDWFLGAKMDRSEVLGATLPISLGIGLAGLLAMLAAGAGAFLLRERQIRAARFAMEEQARGDALHLRRILDNLPTAVVGISRPPDRRIILANQHVYRVFGYTGADVPDLESAARLVFPDETLRELVLNWWTKAVAEAERADGMVAPSEHSMTRKDGAEVLVSVSGSVVDDMLLVSMVDITEPARTTAELRATKERMEAIFNAVPDLMFVVDRDARIHGYYSPADRGLYAQPDHFVGKLVADVLPPDAAATVADAMAEAARTGRHSGAVYSLPLPDGQRWFELSIAAMGDHTRRDTQFIAVARDVTGRVRLEQSLRRSEEQYRLLAENATDIIFAMDTQGRFTYVSPSSERLRGYTSAEAIAQTLDEALTPESAAVARAELAEFLAASGSQQWGRAARVEVELTCKDGSTLWAEVTASGRFGPELELLAVQGIARDITERRRYELELQEARTIAEAANAAKSRFLAHMSHEIRTPLNGVLGLTQVLMRRTDDAEQRALVTRIEASGRTLLALLNDLLDHSKIEAGRLRLEARPFDPAAVIGRVVGLMGAGARDKGLEMTVDMPAEPLPVLLGDELRIEQIILNLVGNAVKFTETGFVRLSATCEPAGAGAAWLRVEVADSGIGIADEALGAIFRPFQQADTGTSRQYGGTGLGLDISRGLAEIMGGQLTVKSRPGHGSRFRFEAILPRAGSGVSATVGQDPPARGPRLVGLRLLVVDDSPVSRDVALSMLQLEGASADGCTNGLAGIGALRTRPAGYDAVLMDLRMPEMDGIAATRCIRQELGLKDLPIIALTAGVPDARRAAALGVGVNAILAKPIELDTLVQQIRLCVGMPAADAEAALRQAPEAEALPTVPGIDPDRAWSSTGGSRTVFTRLLGLFVEEFADVAEATRRHLADGRLEPVAGLMHRLKGSAAALGAGEIAAAAAEVETSALRGEAVPGRPLADLECALALLLEAVGSAGVVADTHRFEQADVPTPDQLGELMQALRAHDLEAMALLERLDAGLHLLLGDAHAADLRSAVTRLRFDEALAILE